MSFNNLNNTYFAAQEADKTVSAVMGKADAWMNSLQSNGYINKLRDMWAAYHGAYFQDVGNGHHVTFSGDQGELVELPVNHLRNLGQHVLQIVCANRPSLEGRATNTDYKSLVQTYLSNGLLDYYLREKRLESHLKKAVETAIVLGAAFIKMEWDATSGQEVDFNEETQSYIYEGDVTFTNMSPMDVLFDTTKEDFTHDWMVCRNWKNKFDLAAKYPEFADKIVGLATKSDMQVKFRLGMNHYDETDDVALYELYHERTNALPDGRYMLFLSEDIVLYDGPMPYRKIPIFRIAPSDILGTPFGYSPLFDILPIQEAINTLYSTILTNQNATGVSNFWVPRGADITISSLTGGLNIIEGTQGHKPEPLNLTQTPGEVFKFLEMLEKTAETISGVNSVSRGNPEASLKSGAALALVQSMSLQFLSGLQQSYVELIENVGTALITMLKDFAATPRVAAIVGKNNRTFLKEFQGSDLSSINRVIVNVGNPLSRTTAGRVQMAEQMLQMHLLKTPQEYLQVINTGSLDSVTEDSQHELLLIKGENERLVGLEEVHAIAIDDHALHIQEHKAVLSDPDLRRDMKLVQSVLAHIQEHIDLLRNTDPDLLNLTGNTPLGKPPAPPQNGPGPGPNGPGPGGPPPGNGPGGPPPGPPSNGPSMGAPGQPMGPPPTPGAPPQAMLGPGMENPVHLPGMPSPPPPFQGNPVMASQMIPQG
jgi:hypothetical protein